MKKEAQHDKEGKNAKRKANLQAPCKKKSKFAKVFRKKNQILRIALLL